jgi:hypothetical protein
VDQQTAKKWRALSRALRVIGAVGCIATFGCQMFLIGYYTDKRPHAPLPERGWSVGLNWTHPLSYGTAQEANRLLWLQWWFFPFFGVIALSETIKIYKLKDYSGIRMKKLPYS